MISIIHPSRGRAWTSKQNMIRWIDCAGKRNFEIIISLDSDDPTLEMYEHLYQGWSHLGHRLAVNNNGSSVEAINNAAKIAEGDILMVVSDDTMPCNAWAEYIDDHETYGKTDWILKTRDGIQPWIITMPIMDRAYYNRFGYIYYPEYKHMFCDTYMTCVADITGRKITSNLLFKHKHYSVGGSAIDEINKKNDATWKQGEETFIRLMKQFTPEERNRIQDAGMKNWLRNHGVR